MFLLRFWEHLKSSNIYFYTKAFRFLSHCSNYQTKKMKKTLSLTLVLLTFVTMFVQAQNKTTYAHVAFHKLKPGHTIEEAIALEKKWKIVHNMRKDAGLIGAWAVYTIDNLRKTPSVDFDYMSVNFSNDLNTIEQYPMDKYAALVAKDLSLGNLVEETAKVQSISYTALVKQIDGTPSANSLNSVISMEVFKTSVTNYLNYVEFEKQMKNIHLDRVNAGEIQEWNFWQTIAPLADDSKGQFTAFTFYKDLAHLDSPATTTLESVKKRMNLTPDQFLKKIDGLRTITQNVIFKYSLGTFGE
jgi:hypothetical protein